MQRGRPTKYDPETMLPIIELEMSEGAALVEIAALLGISRDTLNEWRKDPEKQVFSDAVENGILLSEAWWTRTGRKSLRDKEFNYHGYGFQMKNRFNWADKKEVKHEGESSRVIIEIPKN